MTDIKFKGSDSNAGCSAGSSQTNEVLTANVASKERRSDLQQYNNIMDIK